MPSSSSMRILHVVQSLGPGGMENVLVRVAEQLAGPDIAIEVCCLETEGKLAERFRRTGQVTALEKQPGFQFLTAVYLNRVIQKTRPDLIHTHNLGPLIYASLATFGGTLCPILHGEHSQMDPLERSNRRLRQRRWLYHCCRRVHTVSTSLLNELQSMGLTQTETVAVVNGVDCERFYPAEDRTALRKMLDLPEDAVIILAVGRFGEHKRQDVLIRAFEQVVEKHSQAFLVLVGAGGPREQLVVDQAIRSGTSDNIRLAGYHADTVPWYQAADILVTPSTNEGLSNAVLEAMASGIPVLANSACGNAEVIREGIDGWLREMPDEHMLAAHLDDILRNRENLRTFGMRARENVLTNFQFKTTVENYRKLYANLVKK